MWIYGYYIFRIADFFISIKTLKKFDTLKASNQGNEIINIFHHQKYLWFLQHSCPSPLLPSDYHWLVWWLLQSIRRRIDVNIATGAILPHISHIKRKEDLLLANPGKWKCKKVPKWYNVRKSLEKQVITCIKKCLDSGKIFSSPSNKSACSPTRSTGHF